MLGILYILYLNQKYLEIDPHFQFLRLHRRLKNKPYKKLKFYYFSTRIQIFYTVTYLATYNFLFNFIIKYTR